MKHRLSSINTCAGIWTLCAGCVCVLTFRDVLPSSSLCSLWWMSLHTVIAGLFKCVFNGYICWHSHNVYSKWSKDFSRLNYSTIQYGWLYPADCTHNVFLTATSAATLWFHLLPNKSLDSAGRNDNDRRTDEDGRRRTDGDWRTDRDTQTDRCYDLSSVLLLVLCCCLCGCGCFSPPDSLNNHILTAEGCFIFLIQQHSII